NLNLGAITRTGPTTTPPATGGGTVAFVLPTTGAINTTTLNDSTGILGGWATVAATAPTNGITTNTMSTDLAAVDGSGNVIAYTGYTIPTGAAPVIASNAAANVKIDSTSTGNPSVAAGA